MNIETSFCNNLWNSLCSCNLFTPFFPNFSYSGRNLSYKGSTAYSGIFFKPDSCSSQKFYPNFIIFNQCTPQINYNFSNFNQLYNQCYLGDFYSPSKNISPITSTGNSKSTAVKSTTNSEYNIPVNEKKYDDLIRKYAQQYDIEENFVRAVMKQESRFNPGATGPMTKYGQAKGLMQLIPSTAKRYNVTNPYDPEQSIRGGVQVLKNLSDMYKGDKKMILAAYNWGCGNLNKHGFDNRPAETRKYVKNVMQYYNEYNNLA